LITRTTPNPSFMKGGDYEMEVSRLCFLL
jgi:hypothetical protein